MVFVLMSYSDLILKYTFFLIFKSKSISVKDKVFFTKVLELSEKRVNALLNINKTRESQYDSHGF